MECLITLCYPAQPPKATKISVLPPEIKTEYYTYGAHLQQQFYSHIDPDIISIVMRCQARLPADRPTLHKLEQYVTAKIAEKNNDGYPNGEIRAWVNKILHEPPVNPDLTFAPEPVIKTGASGERPR
jgi:hypothetical protein